MTSWEPAEPPDRWRRVSLAEDGLDALDRIWDALRRRRDAKIAAAELIREVGAHPSAPAPDAKSDLEGNKGERSEGVANLVGLYFDLRDTFLAERRGRTLGEREDLPAAVPDEVAGSYPPIDCLERDVAVAEHLAELVERAVP